MGLSIAILLIVCSGCGGITDAVAPSDSNTPAMHIEGDDAAVRRFDDERARAALLAQENRAFADNYYLRGVEEYERLRMESASGYLKLALRYDPDHREARNLFEKVQVLLDEHPDRIKTMFEQAVRERAAASGELEAEAASRIREGDRLYTQKQYSQAAKAYAAALVLMDQLPYSAKLTHQRNQVEDKRRTSEKMK